MNPDQNRLKQLDLLISEANAVREKDKAVIRNLLGNFYGKKLSAGIAFKHAYGSVLSGDYFNLIKLPDGNYLFIIADISGHGLMAYTILIRLNDAIITSIKDAEDSYSGTGALDSKDLVRNITRRFTDLLEAHDLEEFASVLFTFIYNENDMFRLRFYNRGMLFPIIIRKYREMTIDLYDLNSGDKGWFPVKAHLLSSVVRSLQGKKYYETPECEFIIYEGDRVVFFTDGIIEVTAAGDHREMYGQDRLMEIVRNNLESSPQDTVDMIVEDMNAYIGSPVQQEDDITLLIVDFPPVR